MVNNLRGRHCLSLQDFTAEEIGAMLELAGELKAKQKAGEPHRLLEGKTLGMIFQKPSTRTRVSFEVGMWQLGGYALFLSSQELQIGRGEPIKDTAAVLSRYLDGIMIRTFDHAEVEELAANSSVPVING
ncbi:MAG TPA: ornithine carbamoyltransferase, partial [Firmicutes bacterium]|nr:ornithine carbamoyltransferase [Bacillota bacterium]